jgi:cell division protease FtsH
MEVNKEQNSEGIMNGATSTPNEAQGLGRNNEQPRHPAGRRGAGQGQEPEKGGGGERKRQFWFSVTYIVMALVGLYLFQQFVIGPLTSPTVNLEYSQFKTDVANHQITTAVIGASRITGEMKNSDPKNTSQVGYETNYQAQSDPNLVSDLQAGGVKYSFTGAASPIGGILLNLVPLLLIGAIWYYAYRNAGGVGGMGGMFGVGKSKAQKVTAEQVGVTYKDVGGCDEAIGELQEIIQFLKTPEQFASLGGRIPKGVLLVGPPGTGKTLLAKATAGEAGVSFFESSGSEFIEMFVGVGAARVRDLFEQARECAPAIVFIDEIDAIGQTRGAGMTTNGGNDEREQTLNQLLAEIDGFRVDDSRPVIIMAATNRPEVLDPALLRAGRFDRQVEVGNPDLIGRLQILKIHSKGIKLVPDFDLERAAAITPGFSGADLANVMNEAALLAARRKGDAVTMGDFEAAIERVVAGTEKKTRVMNERERTTVAYHESGHALVAALVPTGDPVAKISIIPRSRGALGYTMQMPTEDRYLLTKDELTDRMAVMLGGRAAENVALDCISTGASDDIKRATELARRAITEFGMSPNLGPVRYAGDQLQYLNGAVEDNSHISQETRHLIDQEVQKMVTEQYERACALLAAHSAALETLARELLEEETVDGKEVEQALGHTPTPRPAADATGDDRESRQAHRPGDGAVDGRRRPTAPAGALLGAAYTAYDNEQPAGRR